jgi:translation initiation factor 5B
MSLANICKLSILHQYVFRNTSPAIFGVKVEGGKLKKDIHLIDENGEKVGRVKEIQCDRKGVEEGNEGQELCISIPE